MDQERLDKIEAHFRKLQSDGKLSKESILKVILAVDEKARQETKEQILSLINEI